MFIIWGFGVANSPELSGVVPFGAFSMAVIQGDGRWRFSRNCQAPKRNDRIRRRASAAVSRPRPFGDRMLVGEPRSHHDRGLETAATEQIVLHRSPRRDGCNDGAGAAVHAPLVSIAIRIRSIDERAPSFCFSAVQLLATVL